MNDRKVMGKSEEKLMDFLWEQNKAMTIVEIEQQMAREGLKKATIFKAVQSLVEQEYLRVNGFERVSKSYARKFEPAVTKEEYAAVVLAARGIDTNSLGNLAMAMLGNDNSEERDEEADEKLIEELEDIIVQLRNRRG
jgi:Penicillinase repressor.